MSPEQECVEGGYGQKTDIFSLGVILYEMFGSFKTHCEKYEMLKQLRNEHKLCESFKEKFSNEGELILRMIRFNPNERPTAKEIIREIDEMIRNHFNPNKAVKESSPKQGVSKKLNAKWVKETAVIIGYNGRIGDPETVPVSSFTVQNHRGHFEILQGLNSSVLRFFPKLNEEISFVYLELSKRGQPSNPVFCL